MAVGPLCNVLYAMPLKLTNSDHNEVDAQLEEEAT